MWRVTACPAPGSGVLRGAAALSFANATGTEESQVGIAHVAVYTPAKVNSRKSRRKLSGTFKTDRSGQAEAASELEECDFNLMKFELEESDLYLIKIDLRSANEDCRAEDLDGGGLETHG